MAEKDTDEFDPIKNYKLWKLFDPNWDPNKCLQDITDLYLSNMNPLIEEHILPDEDLSANHIKTLNKVRKYYDEERRPVTWDKVFATVNRKYTEITSANAVRRYEDFTGLVTKCKEKYRKAMELFVSEFVYSERQLEEQHQKEIENSLHSFRAEVSSTDPRWERHLETFIIDFYKKCRETNKSRLKVTEDLIAQYRCAMTARIQQPLTDKEIIKLHDEEKEKAMNQFLNDTVVEWLPNPTPDSMFLSQKLDSEFKTIKAANSNKTAQVYSSLVDKWTAEYEKEMKTAMKAHILRENEFSQEHEKTFTAIKASFAKEAPTDGPCFVKWSQTLQTKVVQNQRELFLQNSMKQKETIEALIDQHRNQFNTNVRGSLKEQIPKDADREEAICSKKQMEIEGFRENAPVFAEPLDDWLEKLVSEINKVADTVRGDINKRKEERRRKKIYRTTLEEALQQINEEMEQEFGPDTAYALPEFIKESGQKLKEYIKGWFVAQNTFDESCPEFILRRIDEHIENTETKYINQHSERLVAAHVDIPMTIDHREKLRELSHVLVENVELDATFIAYLKSNDVIPQAWADDISNQLHPQRERTLTLLKRLEKRPDSAYEGFMRALKHSGQEHLALQLL